MTTRRMALGTIAQGRSHALAGVTLLERCDIKDFAAWYLAREIRKGRRMRLPPDAVCQVDLLRREHSGKTVDLSPGATWWRARLETPDILGQLLIVRWPEGDNYGLIDDRYPRILEVAVALARASRLFDPDGSDDFAVRSFRNYYRRLRNREFVLKGDNRLVVRSLTVSEEAEGPPGVGLYLHDGIGRALPYLTLIRQGSVPFRPVDVFAALAPRRLQMWPVAALLHRTGEARRDSWFCRPSLHVSGHAQFGPAAVLPSADLTARFHLAARAGSDRIATLDVYDARSGRILAARPIAAGGICDLPFRNPLRSRLEFRVFWHGREALEIGRTEAWLGMPPAPAAG